MTLPRRIKFRPTRPDAPVRCDAHLQFVRGHHCIVPGCSVTPVVAHHVLMGWMGKGIKPGDEKAVSLCAAMHHLPGGRLSVHGPEGEAGFERRFGINLLTKAAEFAAKSDPLRRYLARKRAA